LSLLQTEKERFSCPHKPYAEVAGSIQGKVKKKERALRLEPTT
jgi:hypothetical protein